MAGTHPSNSKSGRQRPETAMKVGRVGALAGREITPLLIRAVKCHASPSVGASGVRGEVVHGGEVLSG